MTATPTPTDAEVVSPTQLNGSYRTTIGLLSTAQKTAKGAPAYSRFVNRPLGRRLAALAFLGGLTPNAVTAISGIVTFAGILLLAFVEPSWVLGVAVAALLALGYALDSADGQLARLRGGGSMSGEWLDHMIDSAKISALHLAVLISMFRFWGLSNTAWLLVPVGFTLVAAVTFFGMTLNDQILRRFAVSTGRPKKQPAPPSTLQSLLKLPTDYGLLCLVFVLLGSPNLFLAAYGALFVGSAAYLVLAAGKWFRAAVALDRDFRGSE